MVKMIDWLSAALQPEHPALALAAVFGSVARGAVNPRDCDILIVSAGFATSPEWYRLRSCTRHLKSAFLAEFGLPLSVILLTGSEYDAEREFVSVLGPRVPLLS